MLKVARSLRVQARRSWHHRTERGGRDSQHHPSDWRGCELSRTLQRDSGQVCMAGTDPFSL